MKEHPILFSTPMVQAIIEGRKTMTRRVVRKNNSHCEMKFNALDLKLAFATVSFANQAILKAPVIDDDNGPVFRVWPKWEEGDHLWVRETFSDTYQLGDYPGYTIYKATYLQDEAGHNPHPKTWDVKWKPSIFMFRNQSRISLEITNIRVERVQDITGKDIIKEGAVLRGHDNEFGHNPISAFDNKLYLDLTSLWAFGWDKINGKKHPWSSNPWCWVIEFEVIK